MAQTEEINDYNSLFKMPVVFEIHYKDGSVKSEKKWIENYFQDIVISNIEKKEVDYVLFDPNAQIPKKITFEKSIDMLLSQAQKAPFMIDRYDAWVLLRSVDIASKREALIKQYRLEQFHGIKSEIISSTSSGVIPKP